MSREDPVERDGRAGDPAGADHDDPMGPPKEPCECWCMHCRRTFMSTQIWFQRVIGDPRGFHGFWMCPTPNCSGAGFTFDIFPTDPTHPANAGWHSTDEDEEELLFDEDGDPILPAGEAGDDWDPAESKYKQLDDDFAGLEDDDFEGEEWKLGLAPGETPPRSEGDAIAAARREWEEEQKRYDMPDE